MVQYRYTFYWAIAFLLITLHTPINGIKNKQFQDLNLVIPFDNVILDWIEHFRDNPSFFEGFRTLDLLES